MFPDSLVNLNLYKCLKNHLRGLESPTRMQNMTPKIAILNGGSNCTEPGRVEGC